MAASQTAPPVRVHVGSILHEYTAGASELDARGGTVRAVLADLESRHPGIFFRIIDEQDAIRPHIKIYVGGIMVKDLRVEVTKGSEIHVLQALSGG